MLAGAGGLHTTYKVPGRSKGFKKGTRKILLDWTLLTQEQAAADPEGWRHVLLGRALIQEPFYTSVAHAMRGAGRELPELPLLAAPLPNDTSPLTPPAPLSLEPTNTLPLAPAELAPL